MNLKNPQFPMESVTEKRNFGPATQQITRFQKINKIPNRAFRTYQNYLQKYTENSSLCTSQHKTLQYTSERKPKPKYFPPRKDFFTFLMEKNYSKLLYYSIKSES